MSGAEAGGSDLNTRAISEAEAEALFADLPAHGPLCIAVSGGPDSTALLFLVARWRATRPDRPSLLALTVDHGLRAESAQEAREAGRLAARLEVAHRILRWRGAKPKTRLQEAARRARYRLLGEAARRAGASCLLTAHTRDDQAETVLFRLSRGSGPSGLAGMRRRTELGLDGLPQDRPEGTPGLVLLRPLLDIPKSRLLATLAAAVIPYASDPSNADPRFARPRWRALMPALAREGLDSRRLGLLARRVARAEAALDSTVREAEERLFVPTRLPAVARIEARGFALLPEEIAIRVLGRALARAGDEGPVELGKLERLHVDLSAALRGSAGAKFRRTLAGALVEFGRGEIAVRRAPPRRNARPQGSAAAKRRSPTDAKKTKLGPLLLA